MLSGGELLKGFKQNSDKITEMSLKSLEQERSRGGARQEVAVVLQGTTMSKGGV